MNATTKKDRKKVNKKSKTSQKGKTPFRSNSDHRLFVYYMPDGTKDAAEHDRQIIATAGGYLVGQGFSFLSRTRDLEFAFDNQQQLHQARKRLQKAGYCLEPPANDPFVPCLPEEGQDIEQIEGQLSRHPRVAKLKDLWLGYPMVS